jgi:NAD(P)-dependent dehydrogenase (short-subunit alcohol dehydrogenase family)
MGADGREHVLPEGSRICVAGAGGLVGSALLARLSTAGHGDVLAPARSELDLADAAAVQRWVEESAAIQELAPQRDDLARRFVLRTLDDLDRVFDDFLGGEGPKAGMEETAPLRARLEAAKD